MQTRFLVGESLQDLSKDKMAAKAAEQHSTQFIKTMENVESSLMEQINYLTQVATSKVEIA